MSRKMKRHDTRPALLIPLTENDPAEPINLTNATSARLLLKTESGPLVDVSLAFGTRADGEVIATFTGANTATSGIYKAEVEITWNDGGIETVPNDTWEELTILDDLG